MDVLEQAFLTPDVLRFYVMAIIMYPFSASQEDGYVLKLPEGQLLPFVALHKREFVACSMVCTLTSLLPSDFAFAPRHNRNLKKNLYSVPYSYPKDQNGGGGGHRGSTSGIIPTFITKQNF